MSLRRMSYATGFGMVAYPVEDPDSIVAAARMNLGTVAGEEVKVIYGDATPELQSSAARSTCWCAAPDIRGGASLRIRDTAHSLSRNARCPLIIAPAPQASASPVQPPRRPPRLPLDHRSGRNACGSRRRGRGPHARACIPQDREDVSEDWEDVSGAESTCSCWMTR